MAVLRRLVTPTRGSYVHVLRDPVTMVIASRKVMTSCRRYDHDDPGRYDGPLRFYDDKVSDGELQADDYQRHIVENLQLLHNDIKGYEPAAPPSDGIFTRLFGAKKTANQREDAPVKYSTSPKGLYLYGSVGSGKTMLMDYFYHTCHVERKRRVHFHQFMLDVHKKVHRIKKEMTPKNQNLNRSVAFDPIPPVARDISDNTTLLCFDEFQVTDIADAMILKRLFAHLWKNGVVMIATSNRDPKNLYKNGLQRVHFLPFIPMLEANSDVLNLDSGIDYRRRSVAAEGKIYFVHSECDSSYEMDKMYEDLVSQEKAEEKPRTLNVLNRDVYLSKTCGRIMDTTFKELCMQPLGAIDYLEICEEFDTILLRDVPKMSLQQRSEARRFITLIDTIYDHKIRFVCSAECLPDHLFATGDLSEWDKHHKRILIGDLDIQKGSENEGASIFSGEEELFAFERVISRLTEMQSEVYWNQREILRTSGNRTIKSMKRRDKSA